MPQIPCVQDTRRFKFIAQYEQDKGTCWSARLHGVTHEKQKYIVIILLKILPVLHKYLITILELVPMKVLMTKYVRSVWCTRCWQYWEETPMRGCDNDVWLRQNRWPTFTSRHQDVFLVRQNTATLCVLLQCKELQGGTMWKTVMTTHCNATWRTFQEHVQIDNKFRSNNIWLHIRWHSMPKR